MAGKENPNNSVGIVTQSLREYESSLMREFYDMGVVCLFENILNNQQQIKMFEQDEFLGKITTTHRPFNVDDIEITPAGCFLKLGACVEEGKYQSYPPKIDLFIGVKRNVPKNGSLYSVGLYYNHGGNQGYLIEDQTTKKYSMSFNGLIREIGVDTPDEVWTAVSQVIDVYTYDRALLDSGKSIIKDSVMFKSFP